MSSESLLCDNRQKPRHVPSFCALENTQLEGLIRLICSPQEVATVLGRYELGTIGLRRYAAIHQDEIDAHLSDFSKRMTRLQGDSVDRAVVTLGFSNKTKRWTLCPSRGCIPKAERREKIVGQWKFLWMAPGSVDFRVPASVHEAYGPVVDDASYFAATLCPQQTYCAKHANPDAFLCREWHLRSRHSFALQDFLVFAGASQSVAAVWRLKQLNEKFNEGGPEAESALLRVMARAFLHVLDRGVNPTWETWLMPIALPPFDNKDDDP